jgi:glycosyltransferase involved in cell wall biosynthesis
VQELGRLGLAGGDFVLFLGRISPEKGCEVLIDAYRSVAGRTKLVIAGHSSYTDGYIEKLRASAPPGAIFPGRVTGRLRAELLGHCSAFVLPSTIEGLSVALLEAMSFGRCVVTTDIPENLELVDGIGLTVPVGDAGALARALGTVLDDPRAAESRGRRAQELVRSEYSWDEVARRTEALYYRTLDG